MYHPFYKELASLSDFKKGNFSLWYNKLLSLDPVKHSPEGKEDRSSIAKKFAILQPFTNQLLDQKHMIQSDCCEKLSRMGWLKIVVTARLKTPLVTGIGESHPLEISLTLDHNLGIPYIPASSLKGLVRFARALNLIGQVVVKYDKKNNKEFIDTDEDDLTLKVFGNQKNKGKMIFLDAYPHKTPNLGADIINPHYPDYYGEKNSPPADNQSPKPIQFLTVKPGTDFIFRFLVSKSKEISDQTLLDFRNTITKALEQEGVGAKTSIGYGLFEITAWDEPPEISRKIKEANEKHEQEIQKQLLEKMTPDEKMIVELNTLTDNSTSDLIASILQRCCDGAFGRHVLEHLKNQLTAIKKWKCGSAKHKEKIAKIKQLLGS